MYPQTGVAKPRFVSCDNNADAAILRCCGLDSILEILHTGINGGFNCLAIHRDDFEMSDQFLQ